MIDLSKRLAQKLSDGLASCKLQCLSRPQDSKMTVPRSAFADGKGGKKLQTS